MLLLNSALRKQAKERCLTRRRERGGRGRYKAYFTNRIKRREKKIGTERGEGKGEEDVCEIQASSID